MSSRPPIVILIQRTCIYRGEIRQVKWPVSGACKGTASQTWLGSAGQKASLFGWCLDEDTPPAAGRDWLDGPGRGCDGVGEDWKEGDEVRRPWMVREFFFFFF